MTTLNPLLQRVTSPQRKPFVRSHTFVDGVGPPPYSFFDETQDHLGGLYHAALGWRYSLDFDEFTEVGARPGYLGHMAVTFSTGGVSVAPKTAGLAFGEHGVWEARTGAAAAEFIASSGSGETNGDLLITAKVMLTGRDRLGPAGGSFAGFGVVALGGVLLNPLRISAGLDHPNWRVWFQADGALVSRDSGIPARDQVWYRLQISRVGEAARFYINGQLVRVDGREGVHCVGPVSTAKTLIFGRPAPGPAGDGFAIDSFHLLAERK